MTIAVACQGGVEKFQQGDPPAQGDASGDATESQSGDTSDEQVVVAGTCNLKSPQPEGPPIATGATEFNTHLWWSCEGASQAEFEQISYGEFPNVCGIEDVWDGSSYTLTGRRGFAHIASDGVTVLNTWPAPDRPPGVLVHTLAEKGKIYTLGKDSLASPQLWLEVRDYTGSIILSRTAIDSQAVGFRYSMDVTPTGFLVYPGVADGNFHAARWIEIDSAGGITGAMAGQLEIDGSSQIGITLLAGKTVALFRAGHEVWIGRACADGSASDAWWRRVTVEIPEHPSQWIEHLRVYWDGHRFALTWLDKRLSEDKTYLVFALVDLEGKLLVTPSRFLMPQTVSDMSIASDGSMFLVAWVSSSGGGPRKFYLQRFDTEGRPRGCSLRFTPPKQDYGLGEDRFIALPPWISHNGKEWIASFCTYPAGPPGVIFHGAFMRFQLGWPAE